MNDPITLLNKLLEDNNLTISLNDMKPRLINDGGLIIEKPQLVVNFRKQPKEEHEPKGIKSKASKTRK